VKIVLILEPPNPEALMTLNIDVPGSPDKSFSLCGVLMALTALARGRSASQVDAVLMEVVAALVAHLTWRRHRNNTFERLEVGLHELLNDTGRAVLAQHVNRLVEAEPEHIVIDGVLHRRVVAGSGLTLRSPYGPLHVVRALYRAATERGVKGARSVGRLEMELGVIDKMTPRMARISARHAALGPSRLSHELMEEAGLRPPSRATLDRFAREVGGDFARSLPTTLEAVRSETEAPPTVALVLVGMDRVSIRMHKELEATESSEPVRKRRTPYMRKPPAPFETRFRMAYVASVTLYDDLGRPLGHFRYAARADSDPAELAAQVAADVEWVRRSNPEAGLDVCQDGATDLWKVLLAALVNLAGPALRKVVDWYHFWQRTYPVLTQLFKPKEVKRWKKALQREEGAFERLEKAMWKRVAKSTKVDVHYELVAKYQDYLKARAGLFDYASQWRDTRRIGSGPIEGTCKLTVNARCKRSGQRWRPEGATAILALSAAATSRPANDNPSQQLDRWSAMWDVFASKFTHEISQYEVAA